MRRTLRWLALTGIAATAAAAQEGPGADRLRQQIMQRLVQSYRTQAGLTPEQEGRFREAFEQSLRRRQELLQQERELWRGLETQMRPGVAASPDSVTRLMDGILATRAAQAEQMRADQRSYATFLNPVQRAQLFIMLERLEQQVEQARRRMIEQRRQPPDRF